MDLDIWSFVDIGPTAPNPEKFFATSGGRKWERRLI
jgi:hypothetical protein